METPPFQIKIVRYSAEPPDQLLGSPYNFRRHSARQQETCVAALRDIGWIAPILVNETTQRVIDGHMRIAIALRYDIPTVPVAWVRLSEEDEKKAIATFDPLGAMASMDTPAYRALLADTTTGEAALMQLFSDLAGITLLPPFDTTQAPQPEMIPCPTCGALMPAHAS